MYTRRPAVAGSFYPSDPKQLESEIESCFLHPLGPGKLPPSSYKAKEPIICVCPHAGYQYSGPVAAHSYLHVSSLDKPDTIIVVGPNHYGIGSGISAYFQGEWLTPLGSVTIDVATAELIKKEVEIIDEDYEAHRYEHSIEVQIPFLQYIYGKISFIPICLGFQDIGTARELGRGISKALNGKRFVFVASSDLTHYEPHEVASRKDKLLLSSLELLDTEKFYKILLDEDISACGYGAIATAIELAKNLGYKRAEILKYATSGDMTGEKGSVVGYPSVRFLLD